MTGHVYNIYGCTHIYIYIYSCTHHLARETTGPALAGRTTPPGTARGLHEASTKRAAGAGGTRRYGSGGVMVSVLGGPPRLGKLDLARTTTPPGVPWDSLSGHRTTARTLRTQSGKEGLWEVEGKTSDVCWRPARFSSFPAWKTASPSAVAAGSAFVAAPPPRTGAWSQPPIVLSPGRGAARLPRVPWVLRSRRVRRRSAADGVRSPGRDPRSVPGAIRTVKSTDCPEALRSPARVPLPAGGCTSGAPKPGGPWPPALLGSVDRWPLAIADTRFPGGAAPR